MAKEELATQNPGALQRPSFLGANDARGTEDITKDDIQMPRLGLAQALSPQIEDGNPQKIDGLEVGMLFNNLSKQVYGKGPISFTVIRSDRPRYIEFIPRQEGGGIRDYDVPANDPRTQFTTDSVTGKSVPPIATKFYDYVIMLLDEQYNNELVVLSLKSTGLKVARALNGMLKMRNAPSFAGKYTLSTGMDKNAKGRFAVFKVDQAGWVTEAQFKLGEAIYNGLIGKTIAVDREPGDEEFDTAAMDAAAEGTPAAGM